MTLPKRLQVLLLGLAATLVSSSLSFAGSGATTVASNTVYKLLPVAGGRGYSTWATNTAYAQGQMVQAPNGGLNYMCLVAGTSTNVSTGFPRGESDYSDGTCVWRVALNRIRKVLVIVNDGAGIAYLTDYRGDSAIGKGIRLNANGGSLLLTTTDDVPQGDLYVMSESDTKVSHYER
jgi:hypothetical protein